MIRESVGVCPDRFTGREIHEREEAIIPPPLHGGSKHRVQISRHLKHRAEVELEIDMMTLILEFGTRRDRATFLMSENKLDANFLK